MRTKPYIYTNPHEPTFEEFERRGIRLDIGCGAAIRPGFFGIDRRYGSNAFPLTFSDGARVPDECAIEVVASHILEHFSHRLTQAVVNEWVRVLKPGGVLRIAVPDFAEIVQRITRGTREPVIGYIMGGQVDEDDYHKSIFTDSNLRQYMEAAGLFNIVRWESDQDDCSSCEISLNLQGHKCDTRSS